MVAPPRARSPRMGFHRFQLRLNLSDRLCSPESGRVPNLCYIDIYHINLTNGVNGSYRGIGRCVKEDQMPWATIPGSFQQDYATRGGPAGPSRARARRVRPSRETGAFG